MAQLFVGQLPFNKFYPTDLLELFQPFGQVIAQEIHIRKGNGFVTFGSTAEADAAIMALHGKYVVPGRNQPLQVIYSKGTRIISEFGERHRGECVAIREETRRRMAPTEQSAVMYAGIMQSPMLLSSDMAYVAGAANLPAALPPPLPNFSTSSGAVSASQAHMAHLISPLPSSGSGSGPAMYYVFAPPSQTSLTPLPSGAFYNGSFGSASNSTSTLSAPVASGGVPQVSASPNNFGQYVFQPVPCVLCPSPETSALA